MKKVLITGGAGFIGSHIADKMLAHNYHVRIYDNLSTGNMANILPIKDHIEFIESDIRNYDQLSKAMKGCDLVFHEAAEVSVPKTIKSPIETTMINDIGTLNVFESARQANVQRVIFASSCAIYGDSPELPKHEQMLPQPKSPYAAQKMMGEYYARLYHDLYQLETVCLRYFNVYGPRQDPSSPYSGVISIFLTKALEKQSPTIYGDGNQSRDFVFVQDVVNANLLAGTQKDVSGNVYNIGTGKSRSINDLWQTICQKATINITAKYDQGRFGDVITSVGDIQKANKELHYYPEFLFEEGLKFTLDWYQMISH
ncbi:MAG: UDP-glucose 4-epimerase [Candidatus Magnetoglobus multicellularis str. Araruama]|uniref:UDP-glucose 4-epimerase n=1 Tax=Candidatus Magnetoglobus multicellularis str. Araruama TaxID=890399 RepID=A0A1V1P0B1_9BACT|nr:MAG: UDP-glucose 4-epimerase [Candidatus Magnetoglobus multicellularis str. Araruama]